jgi:hypothetical protein
MKKKKGRSKKKQSLYCGKKNKSLKNCKEVSRRVRS